MVATPGAATSHPHAARAVSGPPRMELNIRHLAVVLFAAMTVAACSSRDQSGATAASAHKRLNILTWEGYADPSFVKPFEKATGCRVTATYVGTNDEYIAKILAGGGIYDLITPSNDTTMRLIDVHAVEPVDQSRIPQLKNFFPIFQSPPWLTKDKRIYGVPYGWGIMRVILNANAHMGTPTSLGFLWSPKLRGKVSIWDDIEAIYMAARYLGYKNVYNLSDAQLEKVKAALIALKPNIVKYWVTTGEMGNLMQTGEAVAGNAWEPTLVSLRKAGLHVIDVVPNEGRSAWSDSWMIVRGADRNPCVYPWLRWVSSAKAQALAYSVNGYGYSNANMVKDLSPADQLQYQRLGMTDVTVLGKLDWWEPVRRRAKYLQIWDQVKAAE